MEDIEIIFKNYKERIFNLAYRFTGNVDDAKDITQETFIQVIKSWKSFNGDSQIFTWIYKIAKNNCLKFVEKKNKLSFKSLTEMIKTSSSEVTEEIIETEKMHYITQVKDGCLTGLICCLSYQQRLVFILHILLDLPIEQVASVINKSENATRILLHRAKNNIKEFLCTNCSLYDSKNNCRCEQLINFSLKQGWISLSNIATKTPKIEEEIKDLKNEVILYKTLINRLLPNNFDQHLQQILFAKKNFLILNPEKVK